MSLISASRCWPLVKILTASIALLVGQLADQAVREHLGEAHDGVERRPQLVGHVGQELGLQAAGRFQLDVLLLQRLLEQLALVLDLLARRVVGADQQVADDLSPASRSAVTETTAGKRLPSLRM